MWEILVHVVVLFAEEWMDALMIAIFVD